MVSLDTYRSLAESLPDVSEQIHHRMPAFARGSRRFTIFDPAKGMLALRLPLTDPDRAEALRRGLLEPASGKYGAEGWASVDMQAIQPDAFETLLRKAYAGVETKTKRS